MSDPQVQRTLVKSPPELWAEVSDVEALARHLGTFGEIRITRLEPETTVAWEGESVRGTVELQASGWGTKVTLTARPTGEAPARPVLVPAAPIPLVPATPAPPSLPPAASSPAPAVRAEPAWAGTDEKVRARYDAAPPVPPAAPATPPPPEPAAPVAAAARRPTPRSATRRRHRPGTRVPGQAALLVRRQRTAGDRASPARPAPEPQATAPEPPAPEEPPAATQQEIDADAELEPTIEFSAIPEPAAPEPQTTGRRVDDDTIVGVLTGVLDELGSAHHRPFSRG